MGLFDELRCKYPLPIEGANDLGYQTKDTPAQYLENYEIREDGTLWFHAYDEEWVDAPDDHWLGPGMKTPVRTNFRWEQVFHTGEIRFYTSRDDWKDDWLEFSAYFIHGKLHALVTISDGKENQDGAVQPGAADAAGERGDGGSAGREVRSVGGLPEGDGCPPAPAEGGGAGGDFEGGAPVRAEQS